MFGVMGGEVEAKGVHDTDGLRMEGGGFGSGAGNGEATGSVMAQEGFGHL